MRVEFLGDEDFGFDESGLDYDVLFICYESGWYDGDGYALGVKNGKVFAGGLSHCSCYGPNDRLLDLSEVDMEDESVMGELALMEGDKYGKVVLEAYRKYVESL